MKRKWNGSKWIKQERRLAIYLRDGMACCYCGAGVEDGTTLSLDHVKPHSKGCTNKSANLVTSCRTCNSSRGNRSLRSWTVAVANYLNRGIKAEDIERHVRNCQARKTDVKAAATLITKRGSYTAALSA